MKVETSPCTDREMLQHAIKVANVAQVGCKTAIVVLTSICPEDGHGTHVTACVLNETGKMEPTETRAAVRRLRSLADELEQRFAPEGGEN